MIAITAGVGIFSPEVYDDWFHHIVSGNHPLKMFQKSILTNVCMLSLSKWNKLSMSENL
jgi:hypothetical protein